MFDQYLKQIKAGASAAYPNEAVWLITAAGCRQVANVADDPRSDFVVSKADLRKAYSETLLAVVHSHPDGPECPSLADMRGQVASAVPWAIIPVRGGVPGQLFWFGDGSPKAPLIGRGFRHGVTDCYSLIRDYYSEELGIALPEFPRAWQWWLDGSQDYLDGFPKAGFVEIKAEDAKPGDVWLAMVKSKTPNHGGVLLNSGLVLHHPGGAGPYQPDQLSRKEPLGRWLPYITTWLRYSK